MTDWLWTLACSQLVNPPITSTNCGLQLSKLTLIKSFTIMHSIGEIQSIATITPERSDKPLPSQEPLHQNFLDSKAYSHTSELNSVSIISQRRCWWQSRHLSITLWRKMLKATQRRDSKPGKSSIGRELHTNDVQVSYASNPNALPSRKLITPLPIVHSCCYRLCCKRMLEEENVCARDEF